MRAKSRWDGRSRSYDYCCCCCCCWFYYVIIFSRFKLRLVSSRGRCDAFLTSLIPKNNFYLISHEPLHCRQRLNQAQVHHGSRRSILGTYLSPFCFGNKHRHKPLNPNLWISPSMHLTLFLIPGIWGFLGRRFGNFMTVLFFYVWSVLQLYFWRAFVAAVYTWWQRRSAAVS